MITWRFSPQNPDVAQYVDSYWYLEKEFGDKGVDSPKLYPDASAHILLADLSCAYQYNQESFQFNGSGSHCIFPHRTSYVMDHSKPFRVLGLKLKIGALYSIDFPVGSFALDSVLSMDLHEQLGIDVMTLERLLAESVSAPEGVPALLDAILRPRLQHCSVDGHVALVKKVLPLLVRMPGGSLGGLGSALDCSQRTVERSFLKVTGFTIKQCQSILRFDDMLEHLSALDADAIDWVDVAYEFGFSDQPHMIRELKKSIGVTPQVYAEQRDLTIDVYGHFDLK